MDAILMERWMRIALLVLASGGLSCVHSKRAESGEPAPPFGAGLKTSPELYEIEENYAEAMSRRAQDSELKER
jgi:hypothetical protein